MNDNPFVYMAYILFGLSILDSPPFLWGRDAGASLPWLWAYFSSSWDLRFLLTANRMTSVASSISAMPMAP